MGSGFARIPIIEQQVATPRGPAPAQRSEAPPPLNGIATGITALAKGGEELGKIIEVQAEHQQILKQAEAEQAVKAGFDAKIPKIKTDFPGMVWGNAFDAQSKEVIDQVTKDYPEASAYIAARAPQLAMVKRAELDGQGAVQTKEEHTQLLSKLADPLARDAASGSPAVAVAARNHYESLVNDVFGNSPDIYKAYMDAFDVKKANMKAYGIAADNPSQLRDYLKTPEGQLLDGAQKLTVLNKSLETETFASRSINAGISNQQADNYTRLMQQKAEGAPVTNEALSLVRSHGLTEEQFATLNEGARTPPVASTPGIKDAIIADLSKQPTEVAIKMAAAKADGNSLLTEEDRAKVHVAADHAIESLKTPSKQAEIKYGGQLKEFYAPRSWADTAGYAQQKTLDSARRQAESEWEQGLVKLRADNAPESAYAALYSQVTGKHSRTGTTPPPPPVALPMTPAALELFKKKGEGLPK